MTVGHAGPVRVVFVVVDALPHRWVRPQATPTIHRLGVEGAVAPAGWRGVLSSNTYPNHASFVTGVGPEGHRMWVNQVVVDGVPVPASEVGPGVPTLFDRCAAGGRSSALVVGDQHLVGVMGGRGADVHWPPAGRLPDGVTRSAFGYARDIEVLAAVDRLDATDADLLVVQLDETDTAAHLHGPDGEAAREQYTATDAVLGELVARLEDRWDDTVVIVVSDHEQELVTNTEPVTLALDLAAHDVVVVEEGAVGLVVGPIDIALVEAVDGVAEVVQVPDGLMVFSEPGRMIAGGPLPLLGIHGSRRTLTQVAVVGGGHPSVAGVAAVVDGAPRVGTEWSPVIAGLLQLG